MSLEASAPKTRRPKGIDFLSVPCLVSTPVMRLLRAGAEIHGYPSADAFGNHLLLGALEAHPECAELASEQAAAAQRAREAWLANHQPQPNAQSAQ